MAVVALLLMSAFTIPNNSNVELKMKDGNIYVSTNLKGEAGYKACGNSERQKVDAYVFTLYQRVHDLEISNGGTAKEDEAITCPAQRGRWVQVAEASGNTPSHTFKKMSQGEYKATVLAGQAIGCDISGDTQGFPNKSIVYEQKKTDRQVLGTPVFTHSNNVNTVVKNDGMTVFPNPTLAELFVQIKNGDFKNEANITIYDMTGKIVMQTTKSIEDSNFNEWKLNVGNFAEGSYLLRVYDENGNDYQEKIIVNSNK